MLGDTRFDPKIVCPIVNYGKNMLFEMEKAYSHFKEKCDPIKAYDTNTETFSMQRDRSRYRLF